MFKDFSEAAAFVKDNKIRMIDMKYTGLFGKWHHVTLSSSEFNPDLMKSGVGFDASSVGLASVKSGDKVLVPDLSTGFVDPFFDSPTLSFLCNILEADTKILCNRDPREIAQRAENLLVSSGFADESRWGPEFEFNVFKQVSFENSAHTAAYHFDALEASWNRFEESHGYFLSERSGYHAIPPSDQLFNLRSHMVTTLEEIGIPVKYHHHEVGALGQCEIETPMMMGLVASADASMVIKYVTRMVALSEGHTVTFLPKPLFGEAGNGMHFHQQLFKNHINQFYDPKGPSLLSQLALFYIGGLLTHAPALLALTNPSTNSYRRLVPGFEAPINCFFSTGNRSAAIRVPKYATQPDTVRIEFRPPDATCNPYLAMAAMLMAGLDGIKKKIDPTQAGFGPIDEDIYNWEPNRRATLKSLPLSLEDAIDALEQDHDFLIESDVFDKELIRDWGAAKRKEHYQVQIRPHPYEIQMYYDL